MSAERTLQRSDLDALSYGIVAAELGEAKARMRQAEAFCRGHDEIAASYDGPDGHIARHVNARRTLQELARASTMAAS